MAQEVLQSCHDSLEGGHQGIVRTFHRVRADYYSIGLHADVERHVRSCPDCSSTFAEMMQSRSRATLGYRPQANGQQERSVKTVMQSVRVYIEDPIQQDWDEIVERLGFAINNSQDITRKETSFYLVHGWDAQSTLKAMASSLKRGFGRQSDALAWRREVNHQQEIALKMAKEYQAVEIARRASEHNDSLSRQETVSLPRPRVSENSEDNPEDAKDTSTSMDEGPKSLFEPGDRVWLYMERVKPGLTKKLAHRWHVPFRVKGKVEEYAYDLELPDRSGYRFYPLLPEDSWEPDVLAGEYGVKSILDDRRPMETSTRRSVREFLVKWVGYDEPTREPMTNLLCGGLLYDYLRENAVLRGSKWSKSLTRTRNLHKNGLRAKMYSPPCRRIYCTMVA
ncbi:unnamed protein product [Phytophthora fragariaefolia]|uniref:Unnamed protein product n=1 Tax=Phytophthora fragariaefolia TaxID=1490495 RepID=A0A9W6XRG3_9STRA|nr:unnamed protein product [Phytophthora fragariaefolia]